jgi:hypothetical protein
MHGKRYEVETARFRGFSALTLHADDAHDAEQATALDQQIVAFAYTSQDPH